MGRKEGQKNKVSNCIYCIMYMVHLIEIVCTVSVGTLSRSKDRLKNYILLSPPAWSLVFVLSLNIGYMLIAIP
jgi:hypothetical protein